MLYFMAFPPVFILPEKLKKKGRYPVDSGPGGYAALGLFWAFLALATLKRRCAASKSVMSPNSS